MMVVSVSVKLEIQQCSMLAKCQNLLITFLQEVTVLCCASLVNT